VATARDLQRARDRVRRVGTWIPQLGSTESRAVLRNAADDQYGPIRQQRRTVMRARSQPVRIDHTESAGFTVESLCSRDRLAVAADTANDDHAAVGSDRRRMPRSRGNESAGQRRDIWMACGILFGAIERAALTVAPDSYVPATFAVFAALIWQASPLKQICLNRCHDNRPIAVFGFEADLDVFRFGLTHGVWCVGGCWALMVFPMLLPVGHLAAMAAVAVLVFCERLEDPEPPRWQLRGLGRASRIVIARARLRLRMLASS